MLYDFSRFSPQSFEHFIQALAAAAAGGGIQIYGAGRDGAREATFEGPLDVSGAVWNGYTVFQAKYRQFLSSPSKNADWLISEIDKEIDKFSDKKRNLRVPDFYILASNVRLSAASANADGKGQGGIDRVTDYLRIKARNVGIKNVHIWHADTISTLLDVHPGVRETYDFWVQPGDIIAKIMRDLEGPDQTEVLIPYLRRSLRQAREIKTKDIGQVIGRTVTLDEVFIDLPINKMPHSIYNSDYSRNLELDLTDPNDEEEADEDFDLTLLRQNILADLMRRAAQKFELRNTTLAARGSRDNSPQGSAQANRIVLMGGPGQGKSTVGQFFAQLCRARLLDTLTLSQSLETNQSVRAILDCAKAEQIPLIGPPRYPFHIELPRYADALAAHEEQSLSILAHIAQDISRSSDRTITAPILKRWLGSIPSVLILDGLDEVPRSGNREDVIKSIEDLMDELHDGNCDCLVFCTSRPQGYQQELHPKIWSHWLLEPLNSDAALRLARRVSNVLIGEESRREEIIDVLGSAADDEATSPLMTSPLQVLLLLQLVATHNNIPKDRWTLFYRHYETLRDREIAKGGINGNTIRDYRSQIDSIHQDAGYLLHLRAEIAGGADAFFTDDEFKKLVFDRLCHDGFDEEASTLAPVIASLATNRLVFLRSQVAGQVAFDVRSLQEFMAASRLTASPEHQIRNRLETIAGRAHWLHVFKIACSKIYGSGTHEALRTPLIALLDSLDAGDRCMDDRRLKIGARLALQLLVDGIGRSLPLYRRQLAVRTLNLLTARGYVPYWDFIHAIDSRDRTHIETIISEMLSCADDNTRLHTLRTLAYLARHASLDTRRWASKILIQNLPSNPKEALNIFGTNSLLPNNEDLAVLVRSLQFRLEPVDVIDWMYLHSDDDDESEVPDHIYICRINTEKQWIALKSATEEKLGIEFRYVGLNSGVEILGEIEADAHPAWHTVAAANAFAAEQSIDRAAAFLKSIDHSAALSERVVDLPWFLHGLWYISRQQGVEEALSTLESGALGNPEDWYRTEDRWRVSGISVNEFVDFYSDQDSSSHAKKFALPIIVGFSVHEGIGSTAETLLSLARSLPNAILPNHILFLHVSRIGDFINDNIVTFLKEFDASNTNLELSYQIAYTLALVTANRKVVSDELFDKLVCSLSLLQRVPSNMSPLADRLIDKFRGNEGLRCLIPAIAVAVRGRKTEDLPNLPDSAFLFLDEDKESISSGVAMLCMLYDRVDSAEPTVVQALALSPPPMFGSFLSGLVRGRRGASGKNLALAICRAVLNGQPGSLLNRCYDHLTAMAEARPTPLLDPARAEELGLPHPLPERRQKSEVKGANIRTSLREH